VDDDNSSPGVQLALRNSWAVTDERGYFDALGSRT
jgi:hypothetical protein